MRGLDSDRGVKALVRLFEKPRDYDFDMSDYTCFIDRVKSRKDLVEGLRQLSPFADDALEMAEKMDEIDFKKFKRALPRERRAFAELIEGEQLFLFPRMKGPKMPRKFFTLLIPKRFIQAALLAEKGETTLGVALMRLGIFEIENHSNLKDLL